MDINLSAPINSLGYGIAGLNILKGLAAHHKVTLFPLGNVNVDNDKDLAIVKKCVENQASYSYNGPSIRLYHQFNLAERIGCGPHIGFPIFELDSFNERERHHLAGCDHLFVCSKWAKSIVEKHVEVPIEVIPLGVDTKLFNWLSPVVKNKKNNNYVFLNIGKWEKRKGHDVLCKIFHNAFSPKDKVELWLMPQNPFLNDSETLAWENLYLQSEMGKAGKIKILPRVKTHKEVRDIMAQADCGIFPSRAEGWNLELLEMMALGKPVITTKYSAHTEFCNDQNSFLINIWEKEDAYDGKWFFNQGRWARFDDLVLADFVTYMGYVYNNDIRVNEAGIKTASEFSWEKSCERIVDYVRRLS